MSSNNENKGILITQDRMAYCYAIHNNDRFVILINSSSNKYQYHIPDIIKNIADNVLLIVSKYDLIFDTAFIIFKKVIEIYIPSSVINWIPEIENDIYNIFQDKFSNQNN